MPPVDVSLYPLDDRFALLTNFLWSKDGRGNPTLNKEHMWIQFPEKLVITGVEVVAAQPLGDVTFETSLDCKNDWTLLKEADMSKPEAGKPFLIEWEPCLADNLRIVVDRPEAAAFPLVPYFRSVRLRCADANTANWDVGGKASFIPLERQGVNVYGSFAGSRRLHMFEKLGICHEPPATDRVKAAEAGDSVVYETPIFAVAFSTAYALLPRIGWDTLGRGKQTDNLLCDSNTLGAFPVVMREGRRVSSEAGGGSVVVNGRSVTYRNIRLVPELVLSYAYTIKEKGFSLRIDWTCSEPFVTSEFAMLRLPFDLYRSVTTILALPDTAGPAGLVRLPLVINSPNYGTMRVTVKEKTGDTEAYGRVAPFRVHGELWLDLIAGAVPLANGLFEVPQGSGSVELEFELTKIFPFGNRDRSSLFTWWEMPPFYSFASLENILGALPDAWLSGIGYRPDLARFANNAVADSVAISAFYNAEMAAYTPELAPGLSPRELIRVSAEQLLFETEGNVYSNHREFPTSVTSVIDCVWLYVASTGNWDWARRMKDYLLLKVKQLDELEDPQTGLVACSFSGVPSDPAPVMTASWSDSVRSGHLESYVNAHAYRSYNRAAELLERLEEAELAGRLREKSARLKANFCQVFYDPESGQIMQWVDVNGQQYGFRSRIHLGAAIALDLVPNELAKPLLLDYLDRLAASGFTAYEYGLPLYLDPIPAVCHNNWKGKGVEPDGSDQVGVYQNGSYTHHQCYYLLQALYKAGLRKEANELFMKLAPLARNGGLSGGLHSGIDWRKRDGSPSGYEGLLAEQYHFLLAAITGYLGLELTIDGLAFHEDALDGCSDRLAQLKPNFARVRA